MSEELKRRQGLSFLQAQGVEPLPTLRKGMELSSRFRANVYSLMMPIFTYRYQEPLGYAKLIWVDYFENFEDTVPAYDEKYRSVVKNYISSDGKLLDLIQYMARIGCFSQPDFMRLQNLFVRDHIGFRLISTGDQHAATLMPIDDEAEAEANQSDYAAISDLAPSRDHFLQAVQEIRDGHFRGSVTESICGVESVLKSISGDSNATFGKGLNLISKTKSLHPAMKQGLEKIYGWTNSPSGMRHSLSDESVPVNEAEARFMLSACLAFAAWLKRSGAT